MKYKILKIYNDDYGCEGIPEGHEPMCSVLIQDSKGLVVSEISRLFSYLVFYRHKQKVKASRFSLQTCFQNLCIKLKLTIGTLSI